MNVAFDFGISNTDIAVQREREITFFSMPTRARDLSLTRMILILSLIHI